MSYSLLVVDDEALLDRANSRLFATQTVANELVGPPLGALFFATAAALPFLLDAWSFLAASMIVLISHPRPIVMPAARSQRGHISVPLSHVLADSSRSALSHTRR